MSEEPVRGSIVSLFFASDKPVRELEAYDAVAGEPTWTCGKCGVRINQIWGSDDMARCPNNHLNRRPKAVTVKWTGQKSA